MVDENALFNIVDAETLAAFKAFNKHRRAFNVLLQAGVFNTKSGQVLLNFDPQGSLNKISITQIYTPLRNPLDNLL